MIHMSLCDNMFELGGHCAKWNKPDRERQIPYDIIYMWNPKKWTHKTKSRTVVSKE